MPQHILYHHALVNSNSYARWVQGQQEEAVFQATSVLNAKSMSCQTLLWTEPPPQRHHSWPRLLLCYRL